MVQILSVDIYSKNVAKARFFPSQITLAHTPRSQWISTSVFFLEQTLSLIGIDLNSGTVPNNRQ